MNYKEINDKWKVFLTENAFKEDIVIKPEKDKKKRKKGKKEIIVSEKDGCMEEGSKCIDEWEEFEENDKKDPKTQAQAKLKGKILEKHHTHAIVRAFDDKVNLGIDDDTPEEAKKKFHKLKKGDEFEASVVIMKRFAADENGKPPEITYDLVLRSIDDNLEEMSGVGGISGYAAPLGKEKLRR